MACWDVQKHNPHREVAKSEATQDAPITVGEFLERWLKASKNSIGSGAFRQYESHVREHLVPSIGHLLLVDLERAVPRLRSRSEVGADAASYLRSAGATLT